MTNITALQGQTLITLITDSCLYKQQCVVKLLYLTFGYIWFDDNVNNWLFLIKCKKNIDQTLDIIS